MAELHVPLENHGPVRASGRVVYARVELNDEGNVGLRLDSEEDDTPYQYREYRVLTAAEARALAAALSHFADEAER